MLSENQLKEKAQGIFERNPEWEELLATADGQFFESPKGRNAAEYHSKTNKGLKIYTITNAKVATAPAAPPSGGDDDDTGKGEGHVVITMTVKQVSQWAAEQNEVSDLEAALALVTTKGGATAIQARIDQLNSAE